MPRKQEDVALHEKLSEEYLLFGALLHDKLLFARYFFRDELTMPLSTGQKVMISDYNRRRLKCTGRKVYKTGSLEAEVIRVAITNVRPGRTEGLFVTPADAHLKPVWDRVLSRVHRESFFTSLFVGSNKQEGTMSFDTGFVWHWRIEGDSGTGVNMIGLRASYVKGDEMAYGNHAADKERHQTALPGADWEMCGVPNGLRDTPFYELDQTHKGDEWSRHKLTSYDNPIFQYPEAEAELIKEHGGKHTQEYITQVLGEWGDVAASSFSREKIHTFREKMGYKELPFRTYLYTEKDISENIDQLPYLIDVPRVANLRDAVMGVDVGFGGPDPTVITVWYRTTTDDLWRCLLRVTIMNLGIALYQAFVIDHINMALDRKVSSICIDNLGYGKAVCDKLTGPDAHELIKRHDDYSGKVVNADANGFTEVEIPDTSAKGGVMVRKIQNKQHYSMMLKTSLYGDGDARMVMPDDQEAFEEITTTVETKTASGYVIYHPARRNQDHTTDSYRYARRAIAANLTVEGKEQDYSEYGWAEAAVPGRQPDPDKYHVPWNS